METIKKIVESLIDFHVSNHLKILPNSLSPWIDAVDNIGNKWSYIPPARKNVRDYIHRKFGHLIVNPHDEDNTQALTESYVFEQEKGSSDTIVNFSEKSGINFVAELINYSDLQRSLTRDSLIDGTDQMHSAKANIFFLLHGKRGCGKTFYQNYLLSKFSDQLDKEKIIWVRLNLVEDFGDNSDLRHWIYAQLTKIIMRYYDPESPSFVSKPEPISAFRILEKFVNNNVSEPLLRSKYFDSLLQMKQVFYREKDVKRDEPISPELVPKNLGRELYQEALSLKYGFIIVFDGLDRLEVTPHHTDKFNKIMEQVFKIALETSASGWILLAVMRTNTKAHIAKIGPRIYLPLLQNSKEIRAVDVFKIVETRATFIKSRLEKILHHFKEDDDANKIDWATHIDNFLDNLYEDPDIHNLLDMFPENRRAQMQIAQLKYFEYLQVGKQRPYLLIESIVKAGRQYPPRHYDYILTSQNHLERVLRQTIFIFDNHFMPSLFNFPYPEHIKDSRNQVLPCQNGMLVGLRILQLLYTHWKLKQTDKTVDELYISDMIELCELLFNYPREIVINLIEEYHECEFLEIKADQNDQQPLTIDHFQLGLMPKSLTLLEHFLFDIAYLNLAAMRIPLSKDVLKGPQPYFRVTSLDPLNRFNLYEFGKNMLVQWVSGKIINSIGVYWLFNFINTEQETRYLKQHQLLEPSLKKIAKVAFYGQNKIPGIFTLPIQLRSKILEQIGRISETFDYKEDVILILKAHFKFWKGFSIER